MSDPNSLPQCAAEKAVAHFTSGFNCAESALLGTVKTLGRSDVDPRIATGFGGGMGRCGQVCGAVTGASIAIGCFLGRSQAEDVDARARSYAAVSELLQRFRMIHSALDCRDLIDCDLGTEEGRAKAAERRTHEELCPKFVATAAALAAEVISSRLSD